MSKSMTTRNSVPEVKVFNTRCDLEGNSILRIFRLQLLSKFVPMGNDRGGGGMRCLLAFAILHYFGAAIFQLLIRFERQIVFLYRIGERFRKS